VITSIEEKNRIQKLANKKLFKSKKWKEKAEREVGQI